MTAESLDRFVTFVSLERQSLLAPLGLGFRDAVTGAPVGEGLRVEVYPTGDPARRVRAHPNRSGAYVLHRAPGLQEVTRGAGDEAFWAGLAARKSFTVEVSDEGRRYLPSAFRVELPARGLFTWVWPVEGTSAANLARPAVSLRDDFENAALDASKWKLGTLNTPASVWDLQVTAQEQGGQLVVTPRSGQSGKHYNGYLSAATWGATNARASVEVPEVTQGAAETIFSAALDADNRFRILMQSGQLRFQTRVGANETSVNIPYDAALHRWWSLRHDPVGDRVVFETSGDGKSWARRRIVARSFPLSALTIELGAGTGASVPSAGLARFDNFALESNPTPAVPLYSAPTRTPAPGMAVIRAELWNPLADGGRGAPAAHALLEAKVAGLRTLRGVADADGRLALLFPYPEPAPVPDGQGGTLPPPAYTNQSWEVTLRAFHAPQDEARPFADLDAVLRQPAATLWADEARAAPLTKETLRYGQQLVVRSKRTTTSAPLDPTPLPVLLITPAP